MTIAHKIYEDFDRAADSLGINRALSWLKTVCDKRSVSTITSDLCTIHHFSDGSVIFASYSDAHVTYSA